ncbi:MAG: Glucose-6-phosphate isomerase [Chlamydiota bacterium]|jgi:glucose-6-phosphate isomerase
MKDAHALLHQLSQQPIDLTKPGVLNAHRVTSMCVEACGLKLLYGTERIDDRVIDALERLAVQGNALQQMEAMQAGEKVNRIIGFQSENRSALHTAMRDQFGHTHNGIEARLYAEKAARELQKLKGFLDRIEGKFIDLVQIGIGGSDLGPRALAIALEAYHRPHHRVHFLSNVDPDDAAQVLRHLDLTKTIVVVVSKSGTTLETLTNEEIVRARFAKKGLNPKEHFVSVTGETSPMDDPSRYLESFYMWDVVGGRYSATSMVGGVALGFCLGYQGFCEVLKGAHEMDLHARSTPVRSNLPLLNALFGIWNRNYLKIPTLAMIPYSQALLRFPAHLQQLDMESNGKRIDHYGHPMSIQTGPVVWGEVGTNGQHSFYQLIHQGTDPISLEFIGFKESQYGEDMQVAHTTSQEKLLANLFAQSIALATGQASDNPNRVFPGNRPNRMVLAKRLDPYTMGALLAYYEHKVVFQGFLWQINSFDQEGVQLGKVLATKILSHFSTQRTKEKAEPFPVAESYLRQLDS